MNILQEANKLVSGDRNKQYGSFITNWEDTARLYNAITGLKLTPVQCQWMMVAAKLARQKYKVKRDNLVDTVGYLHIINETILYYNRNAKKSLKWKHSAPGSTDIRNLSKKFQKSYGNRLPDLD